MSTLKTINGCSPGEIDFRRDVILQVKSATNWEFIKSRKRHTLRQVSTYEKYLSTKSPIQDIIS